MGQKRRTRKNANLSSRISRHVTGLPPAPKIEVIQEPDTLDPDIGAFLSSFFRDFSSLKPLENISLLSPEDAQEALATLRQTQELLQSHMKTANALKRMLKEK